MRRARQLSLPFLICPCVCAAPADAAPSSDQIRQIAADAYRYGDALVANYRTYYAFAVHGNVTAVNPVVAPTGASLFASPYRIAAVDLRAGPVVVTLPPVGPGRNVRLDVIDFYTRDFARLRGKTLPAGGGCVVVAGPSWQGRAPAGCKGVLQARSQLALLAAQIRLPSPTDLEEVNDAPPSFKIQPLSAYVGDAPPPPARTIDYLEPLSPADAAANLEFFNELAFLLQFCPPRADDAVSREALAEIGIQSGRPFGVAFMGPAEKAALTAGLADGRRAVAALPPVPSFADVFGTPSGLAALDASSTLDRSAPDSLGALTDVGAFEIPFTRDSGGHLLDGSQGRYALTFAAGALPPASRAWALVMLELPDQRPVKNPIHRYFIGSAMLPDMVRGDDGSLTLLVQKYPPGGAQDANWLPAPNGPFLLILRLDGAQQPVLDNTWHPPRVEKLGPANSTRGE